MQLPAIAVHLAPLHHLLQAPPLPAAPPPQLPPPQASPITPAGSLSHPFPCLQPLQSPLLKPLQPPQNPQVCLPHHRQWCLLVPTCPAPPCLPLLLPQPPALRPLPRQLPLQALLLLLPVLELRQRLLHHPLGPSPSRLLALHLGQTWETPPAQQLRLLLHQRERRDTMHLRHSSLPHR